MRRGRREDERRTAAAVGDFLLEPVLTAKRDVHRGWWQRVTTDSPRLVFWFGLCKHIHMQY